MSDLDQAIRARLHLDDPAEDSRDLLDDWDAAVRALIAVLDLHAPIDGGAHVCAARSDAEGHYVAYEVVCPTVRVIAGALGVEADGG